MRVLFKMKNNFFVFQNQPQAIQQFKIDWPISFFNSYQYVDYQATEQIYTFVLTDETQQKALAFFHLFVDNKNGLSPKRGSYGSFEISEKLTISSLQNFVTNIINFCQELDLEKIEIKHFPTCYDVKRSEIIERALLQCGFTILSNHENQYLEITNEHFETKLHSSEKRRLQKCLKAGFIFEEIQQLDIGQVYDFISKNRRELGYKMTFELEKLQTWFRLFSCSGFVIHNQIDIGYSGFAIQNQIDEDLKSISKNIYQVFCVKENQKIIALTITVNVAEGILYNFCPADDLAYRIFSPTVLLTKGLYEYCQRKKIKCLDLGVSIDSESQPKPNLLRFKRNLGALSSKKKVFSYLFNRSLSPRQTAVMSSETLK